TTHIHSPVFVHGRGRAVIHDVLIKAQSDGPLPSRHTFRMLEAAFKAVWSGLAENDGFNALIPRQRLDWRDVSLLRALARYIRQTQSAYTPDYMALTLVKHSEIAGEIVALFRAMFDPDNRDERKLAAIATKIEQALAQVASLDEDQIIRRFINLVAAMVRTNFFHSAAADGMPPIISFKLDSKRIDGLPEPRP